MSDPAISDQTNDQCAVGIYGVTKRFDTIAAVDAIDLQVADGEFFSLLGPSGCGKTTTLRMIAGLEFPTEGSIQIFGEEMGLRPPNRRPVNTVFQSYALFPHMTVEQNVAFGLEMREIPKAETRQRTGDAIEMVRLEGMERRKPSQLSGGQQQRVALARALVNRPKVLLLDEPLGALDLKLRQAMQIELKEIQQQVGITFVFVTHDQEEALTMSDRIGVMNEGRLLQVAPAEDIYERPATRFVAEFIGETNFIPGTVVEEDRVRLGNGAVVTARAGQPAGSAVMLTLRPEKLHLYAAEDDAPTGNNNLACRVVRRMYFGDSRYYELEAGVGTIVDCRVENIPRLKTWSVGEEAVVSFHPQSAEALSE
ncbi:MAG: ABC transporter ATP-binding protein [Actinomycetota bacterium]|nr:ABC transporter ATP-binding protein [Actinomycetota bacterium]